MRRTQRIVVTPAQPAEVYLNTLWSVTPLEKGSASVIKLGCEGHVEFESLELLLSSKTPIACIRVLREKKHSKAGN